MSHSVIDQLEFEALTGLKLDEDQETRYHLVAELAVSELEQLLGWPLDPGSWENQYIEIGKSSDNSSCPDVDAEDLDAADAVVGSYRLFTLSKGDVWLAIDPALTIHAVKNVKNGVTCRTYERDDYTLKNINGTPNVVKHVGINKLICHCTHLKESREFAIDADWAYEDLPADLKKVLADMISEELDYKTDVKSESVVSHSYTKFEKQKAVVKYDRILRRYAGPNGTAYRRII